ncbi:MAG: hypothetical protein AB1898_13490 [Acidobacteriota bacterium]
MLRISQVQISGDEVTARIEGSAVGPWVAEVRQYCEQVLARGSRLTLDLQDLLFAGPEAVRLFRDLCGHGIVLTHCPPYLVEQLKQAR